MLPVNTHTVVTTPDILKVRIFASPILSYSDPSYNKQINIVIIRQ